MLHRLTSRVPQTRIRKSRLLAVAGLIAIAVSLTACVSDYPPSVIGGAQAAATTPVPTSTAGSNLPPISRSKPAAVVAGHYISGADYADAVQQVRIQAEQQAAQQPGSPLPTETQIRSAALNSLVDRAVVDHYASTHGITATDAEVQQQYDSYQTQYGGPITFTHTLNNLGYSKASFKQLVRDNIVQQKVEQKVTPAPKQVKEVRARHILVATKSLADKLYAELQKDPSKFAALAKKYSTDTGSASKGGELGYLPRGATVQPFDQALFSLKKGQISAPVHSQYGYHIIQVEGSKMVAFSSLDQQTQQTVRQYNFSQWLKGEIKQDHVKILVPGVTLSS